MNPQRYYTLASYYKILSDQKNNLFGVYLIWYQCSPCHVKSGYICCFITEAIHARGQSMVVYYINISYSALSRATSGSKQLFSHVITM